MRILTWLVVNTGALALATWVSGGIAMTADGPARRAFEMVLAGCIFGLVNSALKPALRRISLPVIVLTLGLFLLVINALLLLLTSAIADGLDMGFHVDGFGAALLGSVIISIASFFLERLLPDEKDR